jgi:type I restriction enzyme S subunit
MEEIKRIQLSEIADLITKGTTPTTLGYEFKDEGVNFLKIECFDENGAFLESKVTHISEECHKKLKRSQLKAGDVLFSIAGAIGRVAIVTEEMIPANTNQALAIIRISDEQVYLPYIKLILTSPIVIEQFERKKQGVAQLNLSLKDINEISIPLPNKDKQIELAELFDKVADIIVKRNMELTSLDNLIQARFVELFGDPKLNDKGWNAGIISDYYEVKGGKRIPKGMGYADDVTAHPYLRATDMKNETILDDDIHYIDEEVYEHIKRYTVKSGDIYLTNVGVNLGMAGVIPKKYDGANLTENAVKLVPKTEKVIDGVFLAHYINSPGIQDYINERKMSVGVPKLAIFRIETMPLLLPPLDIQMQFIEFHKQVNKLKVEIQKSLDETQILFDSLMQKYFG